MKRIIALVLSLTMILALCACGETEEESKLTEDNVSGEYRGIGLYSDLNDTYRLSENTTFDTDKGVKGTYALDSSKMAVVLSPKNSPKIKLNKVGTYYYTEGFMDCFSKDTEYELEVTFNEEGCSNQSFEYTCKDDRYLYNYTLQLKENGTYTASYEKIDCIYFEDDYDTTYEGTYILEDNILWLSFGDGKYPMILVDGELYFDVLEKVE